MKKYVKYFILFILAIVLIKTSFTSTGISTGGNIYSDSSVNIAADSSKIHELAEGKKLYEIKCVKCHTLYNPKDYRLKTWKENLKEMRVKADLKKEEYSLILQYLSENCKK